MQNTLYAQSAQEQKLLEYTVEQLDALYQEKEHLLSYSNDIGRYDVRGSSHYALGLMTRRKPGDLERTFDIINRILDLQLDYPGEIYHGTFKRSPHEPPPPKGDFPWRRISSDARYFGDVLQEKTINTFLYRYQQEGASLEEALQMEKMLEQAFIENFPTVWATYDPNWREFIGTAFAQLLALFETELSAELVTRIDRAMRITVKGSVDRWVANLYPMNTNIELMHIFLCDFFADRFQDCSLREHADFCANDFYSRYQEFHSVAEFNSPTYNGVDFCALIQWRCFGRSRTIRELGAQLEEELWEDVALFYNPVLDNIGGPFSRNYEMDMRYHTSMHALLYLGLPNERDFPLESKEHTYNILLALGGVKIPERVKPHLREHLGDRQITKQFRELIERGDPLTNNPICTATAWIEEKLMLGGLSGSQNVSGQIHPATAYWQSGDQLYSFRLLRREPGCPFGKGNRSVLYQAQVKERQMEIEVYIEIQRDMELFFDIIGKNLYRDMFETNRWNLPGLTVRLGVQAPDPVVHLTEEGIEIIYLSHYHPDKNPRHLKFSLQFTLE